MKRPFLLPRFWLVFLGAIPLYPSSAGAADDAREGVVVTDLRSDDVRAGALAALGEILAVSLSQKTGLRVLTPADVAAEIGRDQMQQMLGCDALSCAVEIGGALGTRYLVTGSARRLGSKLLVTLSLIDTRERSTVRGKAMIKDDEESYPDAVDAAVDEMLAGMDLSGGGAGNKRRVPAAGGPEGMVLVEAGEALFGCSPKATSSCSKDEGRGTRVELAAFYIDTTEVTARAYRECVAAGKCFKPRQGSDYNFGRADREEHPVNGVDWNQAKAYCEWRGKQLPTEAQWEKAARGSGDRPYPWGEEKPTCNLAVIADGAWGCGENRSWPVGKKPPGKSPAGAEDMLGNVAEWVADWYGRSYLESAPRDNPTGPTYGSKRVYKGGSFADTVTTLRISRRSAQKAHKSSKLLGFRCAKTVR